jgi:hypothetical protein
VKWFEPNEPYTKAGGSLYLKPLRLTLMFSTVHWRAWHHIMNTSTSMFDVAMRDPAPLRRVLW